MILPTQRAFQLGRALRMVSICALGSPLVSADCGSTFDETSAEHEEQSVTLAAGDAVHYELMISMASNRTIHLIGWDLRVRIRSADAGSTLAEITCDKLLETGVSHSQMDTSEPPAPVHGLIIGFDGRTPFDVRCILAIRNINPDPEHAMQAPWDAIVWASWDEKRGDVRLDMAVRELPLELEPPRRIPREGR